MLLSLASLRNGLQNFVMDNASRRGSLRAVTILALASLFVPSQPAVSGDAPQSAQAVVLTNWLAALNSFRAAGAKLGETNVSQAKIELAAAATNLAAPYGAQAAELAAKLDTATSPNPKGAGELKRL